MNYRYIQTLNIQTQSGKKELLSIDVFERKERTPKDTEENLQLHAETENSHFLDKRN